MFNLIGGTFRAREKLNLWARENKKNQSNNASSGIRIDYSQISRFWATEFVLKEDN